MMRALLAAVLTVGLGGLAVAADDKADPTGTWKWKAKGGKQERETTLKLKLDGGKLTGTITAGGEAKIEDGKFEGGEVTFTVTREVKDQKFTSKYKAKVDGDTMKGTVETTFGGKDQKREFEAKRENKDDK